MKPRVILPLILGLALAPALEAAQLADCAPPPDTTRQEFVIDAATLTTKGETSYGLHERVRVVILNKNPFLHEYSLSVESKPVEEPGLDAFLTAFQFTSAILPGLAPATPPASGTGTTPQPPPPAGRAPAPRVDCPAEIRAREPLKVLLQEEDAAITTAGNQLQDRYRQIEQAHIALLRDLTQLKDGYMSARSACTAIRSAAEQFIDKIRSAGGLETLAAFKQDVERFQRRLDTQDAMIAGYEGGLPAVCRPLVEREVLSLKDRVAAVRTAIAPIPGKLEEIRKGRVAFEDEAKRIERVGSAPDAFFSVQELPDHSTPTNELIKVARRPIGDAQAAFVDVRQPWTLNFGGGARFALSGGVAYAQLEDRTFERVQSFPNGTTTAVNVIGYKENSDGRATPLVMLHTRIGRLGPVDLHASFGLSAKIQDGDTNAEYLGGISFSLAEDRFFLTFGEYYGGVRALEGGLSVGDPVPSDLAAIPTKTEWHWKPGIALTLRIR